MIFAAVLHQFVEREDGGVRTQMLVLGVLAFLIGLVLESVWAMGASQGPARFDAGPRRGEAIGAAGGVSMIGLGVGLAATGAEVACGAQQPPRGTPTTGTGRAPGAPRRPSNTSTSAAIAP